MKKNIVKIICLLVFTASIIAILSNGYLLLDAYMNNGLNFSDFVYLEYFADLALTFSFSFLEIKAGIGLYKAIKSDNRFEWYKSFPSVILAIITPIALSYLLSPYITLANNIENLTLELFFQPSFLIIYPLLVLYIITYVNRINVAKRKTYPLTIGILINGIITLIYALTYIDGYNFSTNIFDLLSTSSHIINIILIVLIIFFAYQNFKIHKENPNLLEQEARKDEVSEVLEEKDKYEHVKVYTYKAEDESKAIFPKTLFIISSVITLIFTLYYIFTLSIPALKSFDPKIFENVTLGTFSSLVKNIALLFMYIFIPICFVISSIVGLINSFRSSSLSKISFVMFTNIQVLAVFSPIMLMLFDYFTILFDFFAFNKPLDFSGFSPIELVILVPIIIELVLSIITQRRWKIMVDNIKGGDSYAENRKYVAYVSIRYFVGSLITTIGTIIYANYDPLYIFMCILLIIVSLLSTIAIVYQVKYPISEYSMVKRLKINEETEAK